MKVQLFHVSSTNKKIEEGYVFGESIADVREYKCRHLLSGGYISIAEQDYLCDTSGMTERDEFCLTICTFKSIEKAIESAESKGGKVVKAVKLVNTPETLQEKCVRIISDSKLDKTALPKKIHDRFFQPATVSSEANYTCDTPRCNF